MLIARLHIPSTTDLKEALALAGGDAVSLRADSERGGFSGLFVIHHETQLEPLREIGVKLEVVFDSRTAPDPREEVGKGDRFAAEVERLHREKGPS